MARPAAHCSSREDLDFAAGSRLVLLWGQDEPRA
jgi:hypothetical protein